MVDESNGFTSVNISNLLVNRVDRIVTMKIGHATRAGLIQDCLRRGLEKLERDIQNGRYGDVIESSK